MEKMSFGSDLEGDAQSPNKALGTVPTNRVISSKSPE